MLVTDRPDTAVSATQYSVEHGMGKRSKSNERQNSGRAHGIRVRVEGGQHEAGAAWVIGIVSPTSAPTTNLTYGGAAREWVKDENKLKYKRNFIEVKRANVHFYSTNHNFTRLQLVLIVHHHLRLLSLGLICEQSSRLLRHWNHISASIVHRGKLLNWHWNGNLQITSSTLRLTLRMDLHNSCVLSFSNCNLSTERVKLVGSLKVMPSVSVSSQWVRHLSVLEHIQTVDLDFFGNAKFSYLKWRTTNWKLICAF